MLNPLILPQLLKEMLETPLHSSKLLSFATCAKEIVLLAIPNSITSIVTPLHIIIGLYFVGRLDNVTYLDAVALGGSWVSFFGFSIIFGSASTIDTLVSQAFGRGEYAICGLYLNKSFIIVFLVSVICSGFVLLSKPFFEFIGIDPTVTKYSFVYALHMVPAVLLFAPSIVLEKFLLAQRIAQPQMLMQLLNTVLYPVYCYVLIYSVGLDYIGAAYAKTVSQILYILAMILYIRISGCCKETLVPFGLDSFKNWSEYLKLSLPTTSMLCLDWWGYEIMQIIAGKLGVVELAANTIGNYLDYCMTLFSGGIGIGTGVLAGNCIGQANIGQVKRYIVVGVLITVLVASACGIGSLIFVNQIAYLFTTEEIVANKVKTLIYIVAGASIPGHIQFNLSKVLINVGKQEAATYVNLLGFYGIMIPSAIYWSRYIGLYGVWVGYVSGYIALLLGYSSILLWTNWEKLAGDAGYRIEYEKGEKQLCRYII
eukprot:TRINITY_DN4208_c0_g1_i1.p1 TRINITY_DN4208_c0_g1~~TRINITY_DN4208_c0_g1_i1.p1  ORF type:complete len:483 (+),score=26.67 TRINITY_DN4208_c0_g1_i1:52-1500(+)